MDEQRKTIRWWPDEVWNSAASCRQIEVWESEIHPNYVASKRKDFEERQQSRQEFAQPHRAKLEKVDEDEAEDDTANVNGTAACAFEIFMIDDGEPIEYKDVIGGSAVLNKYDLVTENDLALVENPMLADEENTIMKYGKPAGWKLFAVCLLALVEPVATEPFQQAGQCFEDNGPGEVSEFYEPYWFVLMILASWIIIGYVAWRIGFWNGRRHVLQFRHVRSDRLGRLHAEATGEEDWAVAGSSAN